MCKAKIMKNKKKMKKAKSATNQRAVKLHRAQTVSHHFRIVLYTIKDYCFETALTTVALLTKC